MKMNEATWDRIARVGIGVVLLALSATVLSGWWVVIGIAAGLILTVTGSVGWCPIYFSLRTGTRSQDSNQATSV